MSIDCPDLSCVGRFLGTKTPRGSLNQGGLVGINSHDMCNDMVRFFRKNMARHSAVNIRRIWAQA